MMKKFALPIVGAITLSFLTIPAAWSGQDQQAVKLSEQCQQALKKTPNQEAAKLCREGDEALKGGDNEEAIAKLTQGLEKLGVMVEMGK